MSRRVYGLWLVMMLSPVMALAQILFTDITDVDLGNGREGEASLTVDLDQDGTDDLIVGYSSDPTRNFYVTLTSGGQNQAFELPPPNLDTLGVGLLSGETIGPTPVFESYVWSEPGVDSSQFRYSSHFGTINEPLSGFDILALEHYIPIRLPKEDGWHYAWLRVNMLPGQTNIIVDSWAYETSPDTPIVAGAIPEASTYLLLGIGIGFLGMLFHKRRALR